MPTEEEHYEAYKAVLTSMKGLPVTIRTLDVGGDKVPLEPRTRKWEPNPALGLRAIRYCQRYPHVFHTQLRALLRASVHGRLRIMFPMISGMSELRDALAALDRARAELLSEGVEIADGIEVGVMIEMPSAALMADRIAAEVDFFSIGTNDLIQYALAIDRQNRDVAYLYRPLHLSILRMLQFAIEAAHAQGKRVSICGEMAGEPHYALVLLGLGVDELSMAPSSIPLLRRMIRAATVEKAQEMLREAMALTTADEIERHVRGVMLERFGDILDAGAEIADLLPPA
jgi:phosphotransferase system enzyme I (PtsI)